MSFFECGTLVPGCTWHARAETMPTWSFSMKTTHGETLIRETIVGHIKERIRDDAQAA